jgi:acyl phosphate:glycerol-3-phosphate acyltransferase
MMSFLLVLFGTFFIGYLMGSLPMGVWVGKQFGVDPRTVGSGRTGGTNVYRAAGAKAGIVTALLDAGKGAMAILLVQQLLSVWGDPALVSLGMVCAAIGTVTGHNWSLFLGGRGGAGTMTNLGNLATLFPPLLFVVIPLGALTLKQSRMASVGSLVIAWATAGAAYLGVLAGWIPPLVSAYGISQALLISYALHPNIIELLKGTERRIGA